MEKLKGHYNVDVAISYSNIARLLIEHHNIDAVNYAETALEIYRLLLPEDSEHVLDGHNDLVLAYELAKKPDKSWQHLKKIPDYLCSDGRREDLLTFSSNIMAGFFRKEDYDTALDVCLFVEPYVGDNLSYRYHLLNSLGQIFHKKGKYQLSSKNYESAVTLALENAMYKEAQDSLIYISQTSFERGDLRKSEECYNDIINISKEYEIGDTLPLANAHFNLSQIRYHNGDVKEAIRLAERAIAIRESLVDGEDNDLKLYRRNLELYSRSEDSEVTGKVEYSGATLEMQEILGDGYSEAMEEFAMAMDYFNRGNISTALHKFVMVHERLGSNAPKSAYAMTLRFKAYCEEMKLTQNTPVNKESGDIFDEYVLAKKMALSDENYKLAADICHDTAQFCSSMGDLKSAELAYWEVLQYLTTHHEELTTSEAIALCNIMAVRNNRHELTPDWAFAVMSLALYIYNEAENKNKDVEARIRENLEDIISNSDKEYGDPLKLWATYIPILIQDLEQNIYIDSSMLRRNLLYYAMNHHIDRENVPGLILTDLLYAKALCDQKEYLDAMKNLDGLMEDYSQDMEDWLIE